MKKLVGNSLIILSLLAFDCADDKAVCSGQFTPIDFETFYYDETVDPPHQLCNLQNIDENETEIEMVINSQSEFEEFVNCGSLNVSIDFNEKTVFAGALWTSQMSFVESQAVLKKCDEYLYTVNVQFSPATVPNRL